MTTATVEVQTGDIVWAARYGKPAPEGRTAVPAEITNRFTFRGREWVNYRITAPLPRDWDRGVENILAAPAIWVH